MLQDITALYTWKYTHIYMYLLTVIFHPTMMYINMDCDLSKEYNNMHSANILADFAQPTDLVSSKSAILILSMLTSVKARAKQFTPSFLSNNPRSHRATNVLLWPSLPTLHRMLPECEKLGHREGKERERRRKRSLAVFKFESI